MEDVNKREVGKFSRDFCPTCGKEMRKWIATIEGEKQCIAMCITPSCPENGRTVRAITDLSKLEIKVSCVFV